MRTLRPVLVPLLVLGLLSACSSSDEPGGSAMTRPTAAPTVSVATGPTPEPVRGLPEGMRESPDSPAGVMIGEGGLVHVVTFGSSSNPKVVRGVTWDGRFAVVDVRDVPGRPSTMDFSPTTSSFRLPGGLEVDKPVVFHLGEFGPLGLSSLTPGEQGWVEPVD